MQVGRTSHGFAKISFRDANGNECSLQKSSAAENDFIWFGVNEANPKRHVYGEGWHPVPMDPEISFTTRMHLDREQVRQLLPMLQHFVETGLL